MKDKPAEVRPLYSPHTGSQSQGLLKMWIEIHTGDDIRTNKIPRNITSESIKDMELRLVVWETKGVKFPRSKTKDISVAVLLDNNSELSPW